MRVLLSGQRSFGAAVFRALRVVAGVDVGAVVSPMAGEDGRPDPLTAAARAAGLPWRPPTALTGDAIARTGFDLIVCAHSHAFISGRVRAATRLGAIGYHPSLLPLHRGRDAVAWTVRMRDRVAGGSVYWLTDQVDGGPVAAQEHVFVRPGDTPSELWSRELFPLGVRLLVDVVKQLRDGVMVAVPQDESCATWEPSIGRPPLYRPDLLQLGSVPGMRVIASRFDAVAAAEDASEGAGQA